ncbi:hypothetical protein GCM10027040_27480 [Halomonas shantousis]
MIRLFVPFMGPSTNDIYAGLHWRKRKQEKDACLLITRNAVRLAGLQRIHECIDIVFRPYLTGRMARQPRDTGNYSFTAKMIEDCLVSSGVLHDDRGEYVRDWSIRPPEIGQEGQPGMWVWLIPVGKETGDNGASQGELPQEGKAT